MQQTFLIGVKTGLSIMIIQYYKSNYDNDLVCQRAID